MTPQVEKTLETQVELRIVAGAQEGASLSAPDGEVIDIGRMLRNDMVMQGAEWKSTRLRFCRKGHSARVDVLSGSARILGRVVSAPEQVCIPVYTPIFVGETAIAFGHVGASEWARCLEPIAEDLRPGHPLSKAVPVARGVETEASPDKRRRLLMGGGGVVAASLALLVIGLGTNNRSDAAEPDVSSFERVRSVLVGVSVEGLSVEEQASGDLIVGGFVQSDSEVSEAVQALYAAGIDAKVSLESSGQISDRIETLAGQDGLSVQAEALEGMRFQVRGAITSHQADHLRDVLKSELPGYSEYVKIVPEADENYWLWGYSPESDDRVTTVHVGANGTGHIKLASNKIYYQGAILPSGFVIVGFEADVIKLERKGEPLNVRHSITTEEGK